jgi:hypothetical protein
MKRWLTAFTLILLLSPAAVAEDQVRLGQGEHSVTAWIDGEVFTVMRYSPDRKKPFFLPVTGPRGLELLQQAEPSEEPGVAGRNVVVAAETATLKVESSEAGTVRYGEILSIGKVEGDWLWVPDKNGWIHRLAVAPLASNVTRLIIDEPTGVRDRQSPLYYDHPHHKGVWISIDEVNEGNFWSERDAISTEQVEIVQAEGNPAVIKRVCHWLGKDEKPIVSEHTTVSLFANRLMVFDITFRAEREEVTFHDTKEGLFGIRLPNSMREMAGGGPVVSADGVEGANANWGKTSRWIDYNGPIDGRTFGATIMDHPDNPRPSRYHVRDYGLFTINPFGAKSYTGGKEPADPPTLKQGETTRYRYGLWIHGEGVEPEDVERVYEQFVQAAATP